MGVYSVKQETVIVCGQEFVVSQANVMAGAKRDILITEAHEAFNRKHEIAEEEFPVELMALRFIETLLYPSLVCCTVSKGEPLPTIEEFLSMPSSEQEIWENAVKRQNPHFFPASTTEQQEKKD